MTPLSPPAMDHRAVGKLAAIDVKMSSDMPLPTPRSEMSSPSHMMRPVPAVMVRIMSRTVTTPEFGMTSTEQPWKSPPLRATVMTVVDCRMASAIVRYRVYCVSFAVPD